MGRKRLTEKELEWLKEQVDRYEYNNTVAEISARIFYLLMYSAAFVYVYMTIRSNNGSDK